MKKYTTFFWTILIIFSVAKLLYIGWGPLDLAPDEAHYWDWSRRLDLSYYSKGPFIAYDIRLGTRLGEFIGVNPPNPAFWVRFPAVLNSFILGIITWFFVNRLWRDKKVSFYVILILVGIPIYAVGSIIITVDNPLMLFWALYIYLVFLALEKEDGRYWYVSGIALGLGFLSKYTMIILIPCVILYLITTQQHRYWLRRREFYFGLFIACLFFSPVILWNLRYGLVGIKHLIGQAGLGKGAIEKPFFSLHIFEFICIQMGVISPVLFILVIIGFFRAWYLREDYRYNLLFWTGVPLGIFYLFLSLHKYCQANWSVPVYFSGAILVGEFFCGRRVLKIGIGLGIFMWLLVFCIDLLPSIPDRYDPTLRLRGWRVLGAEIGRISSDFSKEGPFFIFSNTYQLTSELAFYIPGHPRTYCVNTGRRMNQYDIWGGFSELIGYNAIYVKHRERQIEPEVIDAFISYEKLPLIDIKKADRLLHQYSVFLCRGFKGFGKGTHEVTY